MGLAASQARLLTITARLSDNELRSQTINNAKMRLATQSSQASENYINALNNATLKFSNYALNGEAQTQNLTYNALTAYSPYNTQYGLVNNSGQLLVSESEAALFQKSNGDLNTYLQYHGLKYETTYFDKLGTIENPGYVEPFDVIPAQEMKKYFERYNSYENSHEVERYENAYNKYISSRNALTNASEKVMKEYFINNSNPNIVSGTNSGYSISLPNGSFNDKLIALKAAFTNPNNSFAFNNPIMGSILKQEDLNSYNEILNSIQTNSTGGYTTTVETDFVAGTEDPTTGITTHTLDNNIIITVSNGLVSNISFKDNDGYTFGNAPTGVNLTQCINNLQVNYSKDNDTERRSYHVDSEANGIPNKITQKVNVPTATTEDAERLVNELLNEILKDMLSSYGEDFANALYDSPNAVNYRNMLTTAGIDLNKPIQGSTKTLAEFYSDYANAEEVYLTTIFNSDNIADVKTQIDNGFTQNLVDEDGNPYELTYRDLTDIEFILHYMKAEGFTPSATFETVIKEYMVDNMIAEYGTPKYAWIDYTDTENTGNADKKAQWYTNLFNRMLQGGYKAIENGLASSSQWLEYALESGIVTLEQVDSSYKWQGLDYKACSRITEETDDAAVTKAEAEYSRAMNDIEAKDSIYDLELKNIDTEHSALQTEYESIKGVISKNIDRTFNFYKNA